MFQPVVPFTGYVGWRFLERTLETQQAAFENSASVVRTTDHFRDSISGIATAKDLVADRQLLSVALGAFGLSEDIDNKFFIEKVLSDGVASDDALSNKIADKRYRAFSEAFGFGRDAAPNSVRPGFAEQIILKFNRQEFERAVGQQDNSLRLALNVETALQDVSSQTNRTDSQWFAVMGNPPLREVVEKALGLPSSIARVNIDQQLTAFKERASATFGTDRVDSLMEPENQEKLIRLYLIRNEAATSSIAAGASAALTLLQSAPRLF